jgi:hypothetical protein
MLTDNKEYKLFESLDLFGKDTLFSYKGIMNNYVLTVFLNNINPVISSFNNPVLYKKIKKVFIELTHNILYYSEDRNKIRDEQFTGSGFVHFRNNHDHIIFTSCNKVKKKEGEKLIGYCKRIKNLDYNDLRNYKRMKRNLIQKTTSNGAGIGLIKIALISSKKIDADLIPYDKNFAYYIITVKFDKNKFFKADE